MPLTIDTDLITILGTLLGIVGILLATAQTISARRAKRIYRTFCRSRCKQLVDLARELSREVLDACDIVSYEAMARDHVHFTSDRTFTVLASRVNGIRLLTARLASFCENLNDEYGDQFGEAIFPDIATVLPEVECLHAGMLPAQFLGGDRRPEQPENRVPDNGPADAGPAPMPAGEGGG